MTLLNGIPDFHEGSGTPGPYFTRENRDGVPILMGSPKFYDTGLARVYYTVAIIPADPGKFFGLKSSFKRKKGVVQLKEAMYMFWCESSGPSGFTSIL